MESVTTEYALNDLEDETSGETVTNGLIQTDAAINPEKWWSIAECRRTGHRAKYSDTAVEAEMMSKAEPIINDLINRKAVDESESAYLGISADITEDVANTYYAKRNLCHKSSRGFCSRKKQVFKKVIS